MKGCIVSCTKWNLKEKLLKSTFQEAFFFVISIVFSCAVGWKLSVTKIYKLLLQSVAYELSEVMVICLNSSEINNLATLLL